MLRFEDQIHTAYLEALRTPGLKDCVSVVDQLRNIKTRPEERDRLWTRVIDGYRAGPREPWAALILETIREGLIVAVLTVPFLPSSLSMSDLTQQMIAEVLKTALEGPSEPARWTPNRLLTRATGAVYDWLIEEKGLKSLELQAGLIRTTVPGEFLLEIAELRLDLAAGRIPERPLALAVYRWAGERFRALADAEGINLEAFWKQQQRAMAEVRSVLTAA